jgi:two-component system OmpR family sensor kinase
LARGDEAGTQHLARENLVEIVREAVVTASAVEPDRVRIATEVAAGPMWAMVDGDAFLQVGAILLDNARKYAPDESIIVVVLNREGDDAVLTVTDRGPGIAPEHHERIFERFYRVDASRTTRGAGLGLAIARDIVERHGGTLAVSSVPGHGATFTVRIPLDLKPGSTESVP